MALQETNILNQIRITASKYGAVLFKNVRGLFLSQDGSRKIQAGLQPNGCSDLIGWKTVVITPEMVGKKIAQFVAIEVKTKTGTVSPEQKIYISNVKQAGGLAGVCRSEEDAFSLLSSHA